MGRMIWTSKEKGDKKQGGIMKYGFCDLLEYLSQRAVISEVFCDGVG